MALLAREGIIDVNIAMSGNRTECVDVTVDAAVISDRLCAEIMGRYGMSDDAYLCTEGFLAGKIVRDVDFGHRGQRCVEVAVAPTQDQLRILKLVEAFRAEIRLLK